MAHASLEIDLKNFHDETDLWMVILTRDLKYAYANKAYVVGMKAQWKFDVQINEQLHERDPLSNEKSKVLLQKAINGERAHVTTNFGLSESMHWYNVKSFPNTNNIGCIIEDITDIVITGQQNTTSYRYRFLRALVHQLRSPLNGISGMIQLIQSDPNDPDIPSYIDQMSKSSKYVLTLINDIVDLDEKPKEDIIPYNLSSMIEDCLYCLLALAHQRNLHFEKHLCDCFVSISDIHLKQILIAFIDNAIKFCNEGSTIVITSNCKDDEAKISVSNEGSQISQVDEQKLFEVRVPLPSSSRVKQTGFGLSMAKALAEQIRGRVGFSRTEHGSTFWVIIPKK